MRQAAGQDDDGDVMPFEIRQLRYAVAAQDAGSFASAARSLRVKQSTLSRRILALEHQVGLTIFERSTQGAIPTRAGAEFLAAARRIIEDAESLRATTRAVGRGEAGRLVLGFSTSLSAGNLRAALAGFRERFPLVEVQGVEAGWDVLMRGLTARSIDLAIVPVALSGERLARRHLWPERLMVALPEDHPVADADAIFWSDLREETFVLPRLDPGPFAADLIRARLQGMAGTPTIIMQDVSRDNILSFLAVAGYATLVAETAAGAQHPGVVLREIHDLSGLAHVDFWAWWDPHNANAALAKFLRLVGERYPGAGEG